MLSHAQTTLENRKFTHKSFLWKSLGVNFDYKLNFAKHIEDIFHHVFYTKTVKCTCKIDTTYDVIKKLILTNAFFKSQVNWFTRFLGSMKFIFSVSLKKLCTLFECVALVLSLIKQIHWLSDLCALCTVIKNQILKTNSLKI